MNKLIGVSGLLAAILLICYSGDKFISQDKLIREQQEIIRAQRDLLIESNDCVRLAEQARKMRDEQFQLVYGNWLF